MFTLSVKAGWTLARLLDAMDPDLPDQLSEAGLEPMDFADPDIASEWLMPPTPQNPKGRGGQFQARVEWKGGQPDVTPIRREPDVEPEPDAGRHSTARKQAEMDFDDIPM